MSDARNRAISRFPLAGSRISFFWMRPEFASSRSRRTLRPERLAATSFVRYSLCNWKRTFLGGAHLSLGGGGFSRPDRITA